MIKPYTILLLLFCSMLFIGCSQTPRKQLNWQQEDGYRWSELEPGTDQRAGFVEKSSSQTNIQFTNNLTDEDITGNRHYLNGSGVALADVDGDGWTDIYLAQLNGPNKLYKNNGGFEFTDITDSAGVAHEDFFSTGVAFADVDGDNDQDLIVASMTQDNVLYINDGSGHFTPKPNSGITQSKGAQTLALADIDSDGDLDLYITNYKERSVLDLFDVTELTWEKTVKEKFEQDVDKTYTLLPPYDEHYGIIYKKVGLPERREIGNRDELYLNNGDGTFEKITDLEQRFLDSEGNPKGLERDWGLTARFHDINRDGLPDLYVCNDFWTKDRLWLNQGDGVFREIDPLAMRNLSFSSMAVDFSDVNRDGSWDFFVTEMLSQEHEGQLRQYTPDDPYSSIPGRYNDQPQYNRNSFYLNREDNTFSETSYFSGLHASGWSWASRFLDVDLDGYEDLLITTGYSYDVQDLDAQDEWRNDMARTAKRGDDIHIFPPLRLPNKIFHNNGNATFSDTSSSWGFTGSDISQGMAVADLDHDGDLDVVMNRLNEEVGIYENRNSAPRIAVRLVGREPNTQAIGATVELQGGPTPQMDEVASGGEYLSHSASQITFAADPANPNHILKVTWPNGQVTSIDSVRTNRIYEIHQPENHENPAVKMTSKEQVEPIFLDVSDRIDHRHHESPYDDFRIQPLLPKKLSQLGPGISWIDFDGDQDDDLFITSGRDGQLGLFENSGNGQFVDRSLGELTETTPGDQTAILGLSTKAGTQLLLGNANYEPGDIKTPSVLAYTYSNGGGTTVQNIPGIFSTTGPIASADYDSDGDLDLFVGGRFVPAHYPMNATSRLFKNEDGQFVLDQQNSRKLNELGMVTGALFFDFEQDGDQDLLLSLEWGPLKLYRNDAGNLQDISESVGLASYRGWWNGVATGDFNNDGRMDIVATNQGLNSPYQLTSEHPLKMYYQDFNRDGRVDIIESYYSPVQQGYVPRRQMQEYQSIATVFASGISSNKAFANATVNDLLNRNPEQVPSREINTLAHTLFIYEGNHFSAKPLSAETQYSAAFYAGVADYDNDGNEDLFLSQNFFDVKPNTPRLDGGRGLLLKGDGTGNFDSIPGHISGIRAYGDQRGAALSDFNADGKVDFALSQNAAETKLFLNQTSKTGITVRLLGPSGNTKAYGSSLRLIYSDGHKGPRREVQAGGGYWSQNSATQVMGYDDEVDAIEVQWFDGRIQIVQITSDTNVYQISYKR
ncbi:FG-GAP-like repeat-containing protein [Aliifodinibius sp. S!AR15-10]|uniref:FG-GAP-like repeat-containing protein n=1 Tax=Aliifodinibius sp. S!AR15-10 TaxID=2950437 RepID=UPI00285C6169|nr:FG-GAP-like repeat-containing protein [Aliifodinibius sp. S!AR15-10]MDR8390625.1 FG-GAP-like repeat-containing protein [Aliifodinibius sp. S!AR15-10]